MKPSARRMIEDMTIRHFVARTQTYSIRTARTFAAFLGQSPDQAEPEDFRRFQSLRVRNAVGLRIGAAPVVSHGWLLELGAPSTGLSRKITRPLIPGMKPCHGCKVTSPQRETSA